MRIRSRRAVLGILIILMLGACGPKEVSRQEKVEAVIKEKLKDPDSAKFDNLYEKDGWGCILVNAKNEYGGYTGKQPVTLHIGKGDVLIFVIEFANRDKSCRELVETLVRLQTIRDEEKNRASDAAITKQAEPKDPNIGKRSGETMYKSICGACHESGVAGAPKIGDVAAWKPRIKNGLEPLVQSAIKGKNAMPPRGASDANDDELRLTIIYMANRSGGSFK